MEIAVDAHATRLLLQISPPEACVDSSLGPYVTSILRESLTGTPKSRDATHDLVELLESHCQISSGEAREVLSSIAMAVQTGKVSDPGGNSSFGDIDNDEPTTRSRSKSLGAEPAYCDVEFLGKILRDTMVINDPLREDSSHSPLGNSLNIATGGSMNSCVFISKTERTKQRSVTFDETPILCSLSPMMFPTFSPATKGITEENAQVFDPLEGILGVLDLEGEYEAKRQTEKEIAGNVSNGEMESKIELSPNECKDEDSGTTGENRSYRLEPKNATRSISSKKTSKSDAIDVAAALFRPSRPRSNSLRERKNHENEANNLAASLFRPSRPRSNSLMDHCQRPLSPSLTPFSLSSKSSGVLSGSLPQAGAITPILNSNATTCDSAELKSTVQLLLTLNSHLGYEAATVASQLTGGDLNLAQYLIEAARSDSFSGSGYRAGSQYQQRRSRLCRHELRGTCYRADCPYSHDFSGVTCLFWLKGRCREGSCRFLHGFAENLLEGICKEYLVEQQTKKEEEELKRTKQQQLEEEEEKNKIHTTNLLHHNQWSTDKFSPSPLLGNGCWAASIVNNSMK
eukprot:CAMPEP_0172535230 /NCGR_PEP_ID=MMETSP1067-20121228/7334_1 /TAXON_ID=265564 ORGANISM="Thalassiosira punctigera, Strain Tpunct2005C2" /NCGR_SAMPLE_ID=MMETSP1067 /ASSEMBLY_ACC=CAM_ASM_000444 /LENGTH=571 /DNA_ID=CAMNT_0013320147 /DNA_START=220 /DNA_END=1935 /DNA_ORIENTATION=+